LIYSFRKEEKLIGKTSFEKLVKQGISLYQFPFRLLYLQKNLSSSTEIPEGIEIFPARIGISVPKRKFKRAVDRNRIKRIIRESYRKLKGEILYPFLLEKSLSLDFLIIYTHSEILDSKTVHLKIQALFLKFKNEFKEKN
jgi:ribonuclease P protein component